MKKTALITGASTGIGKELAKIHASKGGDLVIVARREEKLNELKTELEATYNISVKVMAKDLTVSSVPQEIYDELKNEGIVVDYLINNAGFGGHGKFHERPWEKDLAMIQLNVVVLTELTRLFLPDFVKRNSGKILNVSSTASLLPGPLQAVYYATKAYVTSFSNAIAEELHDTNVTVTALLPGATETEFAQTSGMDKTDLFKNTFSAASVALSGYEGMIAGKLDVMAGLTFTQRMMMASIPLTPKKMLLSQVRKMQEIDS
ncbi:MAG: SDR family oxidoreductase [Flavobacteriales bacterium]|nr:SDR family oxidoreductase [Flavobacteriales bacterium]